MTEPDYSFADKILEDAQLSLASGVDCDELNGANREILGAIVAQAQACREADFKKQKSVVCPECAAAFVVEIINGEALAKSLNHLCKSLDGNARLTQFLRGAPDSRPELAGGMGFAGLKPEQLAQVMDWLNVNEQELRGAHE